MRQPDRTAGCSPGRILYSLMNLHFLLVRLARDLVRIRLRGLSLGHCATIGRGVAAGDQNGCGEQHNQRNLTHRSSSRTSRSYSSFPLAVGIATGPMTNWGTGTATCPLRTNSVARDTGPSVHQELGRRARCTETAHTHIDDMADLYPMKKIGFLSFGHWAPSPQSRTQSGADALLQSIDLAVEAERLGMDGAFFRVHHFAQQLASPFPLLAAVGAKTRKIEIGTAVIDMRYENPHYMAEDAGAADLISGGRLQLGISRGSPEQVIEGWRYFGYQPMKGEDDEGMGRRHAEEFLELLRGKGFAQA